MKYRTQILVYGISLGLLAIALKLVEYRFMVYDHATEIYVGIVAALFTGVGVWVGIKLRARKLSAASSGVPFALDPQRLQELEISAREYEVLKLIAQGFSTKEIAEKLFVSSNTVKTHTANLFQKLDAKRRTHAVQRAKALGILP